MSAPERHHLDKRASALAVTLGVSDDLLNTSAVAELLGVSTQWVEIGRHRGYGPPFIKLSPKRVRYRRSDLVAWLSERTHRATSEYETAGGRPRKAEAAD